MKKAHLFLICGLAAAVGTVSCEEERPMGEKIYTTHFIQSVTFADALECRAVEDEGVIYLFPSGTSLERAGKGSTNNFYNKIGDTDYNRYVAQDPSLAAVFANQFASIDISSSEQFLDIPAGESIAEYVIFRSATAMPYIESKYTVEGNWSEMVLDEFMIGMGRMDGYDGPGYEWYPEFQRDCFHPVVRSLSELTHDDLFLLWEGYPGSSLRFTAVPEIKSHTFTVTMRDTDGSVLTCSVPFTFPEQ